MLPPLQRQDVGRSGSRGRARSTYVDGATICNATRCDAMAHGYDVHMTRIYIYVDMSVYMCALATSTCAVPLLLQILGFL